MRAHGRSDGASASAHDARDEVGRHLAEPLSDLLVGAAGSTDTKRMVSTLDEVKLGPRPQPFDDPSDQREIGQGIGGALDEQHGDPDGGQVRVSWLVGPPGSVERIAEEDDGRTWEPPWVLRGEHGSHPAAERLARRHQRQAPGPPFGLCEGRAPRLDQDGRPVRTTPALLGVGEVEPHGGDAAAGEPPHHPVEELVPHVVPRSMRDEADGAGPGRVPPQGRQLAAPGREAEPDLSGGGSLLCHAAIMPSGRASGRRCENRIVVGTLYLGTSGFAYGEWKGPFYPPSLKQRDMLPFYATRFGSVEINYTFRQQPAETTLAAWRE